MNLSAGQQDTVLSEKGRRQAQLAGFRLQCERFTHAYASDLKRAYEVKFASLFFGGHCSVWIQDMARISRRNQETFASSLADV